MTRLSDFVITDKLNLLGIATLDVARLMELSDRDFVGVYRSEIDTFMDNHGHNPRCSRCSVAVRRDNLVRYFGENLHYSCFITAYFQEREELEEREQDFFDRVVKLVAS